MRLHVRAALTALVLVGLSLGQSALAQTVRAEALRAHTGFLASDLTEGREPGTTGYDIAAAYVVAQFEAIGLRPVQDQSWYIQTPLQAATLDQASARFTISGVAFANRKDVLFGPNMQPGVETLEGKVVFAGFGIDDPERGFKDFAGLDVKGKFVAVLTGFPKGIPSDVGAHYARTKARMATERGAIGVISIRTNEREIARPWLTREVDPRIFPLVAWHDDKTGRSSDVCGFVCFPKEPRAEIALGDRAAKNLFWGAPKSLTRVLNEASRMGGRPKSFPLKPLVRLERASSIRDFESPNIFGALEGADPALTNEYVLLVAHLDHLGRDPLRTGDQIFNGASDNASGVAQIIEIAQALASAPERPKRPIIFVALTAEERGLLGADYLANHSLFTKWRTCGRRCQC